MKIFASALLCVVATNAFAASPIAPFTRIASPPGGDAARFVFDANTPGVVLMGSSGGLIYRSTDGGATWARISVGRASEEFRVIGQSPAAAGVFYAYSTGDLLNGNPSGRVYVSTNDGVSWSVLPNQPPLEGGFWGGRGRGIAIDPSGQIIVLTDAFGAVFRSSDAGQTWSNPLHYEANAAYGLAADPTRPGTLWAAGTTRPKGVASIWKSTDFGATWTAIHPTVLNPSGSSYDLAYGIAVQPGTGDVFVAYEITYSTGEQANGMVRSANGGATWFPINKGLLPDYYPGSAAGSIAFDPTTPSTVYLATNGSEDASGGGFYKSTDSGNSWAPIGNAIPFGGEFVVAARPAMPGYPAAIFAGYPDVAISTDHGASWSRNDAGFDNAQIAAVADDVASGWYYAIADTGVFHTRNGGLTWSAAAALPTVAVPIALAVDLAKPAHPLFVATSTNVFRSINGGAAWQAISPPLQSGASIVTIYTDVAGNLYVIDSINTVYISATNGGSWNTVPVGNPGDKFSYFNPSSAVVLTNAPAGDASAGRMYASLSSGLWISSDYGRTWQIDSVQPDPQTPLLLDLAVQHVSPYTIFVGTTDNGVLRSSDGGQSFDALPLFPSSLGVQFWTAPAGPQIYLPDSTSSLYQSLDALDTVTDVSGQLINQDGGDGSLISLTNSTLFISDYDGATFSAPYTSLTNTAWRSPAVRGMRAFRSDGLPIGGIHVR